MSRLNAALGMLAGVMLVMAPPARADTPPALTSVTIVGDPVVGSALRAEVVATGEPAPAVEYSWERCDADQPWRCQAIAGATGETYVPVAADLGSPLVVRATARNLLGSYGETSDATAPVRAANDYALPTGPQYLRPFPVVRLRGSIVARGVVLTLLRVTAPRTARVSLRCTGAGCPARRLTRRPGRIRRFERFLPARTRITIRVRRPGYIGKYVRVTIRAGKPPARRDACVVPGSRRPVECPPA